MFEDYVTFLSLLFVLRGLVYQVYRRIYRKTSLRAKGKMFLFNRMFAQNASCFVWSFWLGLLWLCLFVYKENLLCQVM
jgi:hypothetical protein